MPALSRLANQYKYPPVFGVDVASVKRVNIYSIIRWGCIAPAAIRIRNFKSEHIVCFVIL